MSSSSARVLQLLGPSEGGIRQHVQALADDLRAAGWHVSVAGPQGVLPGAAAVPVPDGLSWRGLRAARRRLAALVSSERPDVVHAHGLKAGWVAIGVAPSRTVLTVHNLVLATGVRGAVLRFLERRVVARSAAVVATSAEVEARLGGSARTMVVVPPVHAVRLPARSAAAVREELGATGPLVVSVGRLHPQKGLDVLVRAMPAVLSARPDAQLVVAGSGPERDALAGLVSSLGLGGAVALVGARTDATDLLSAADVVVIASRWESGPLTLLEAGAVAAPVVATAVGFVPELVVDGVTGWIVPVDDAEALAAAMIEAMDDPVTARARGAALAQAVGPRLERDAPRRAVEAVYREVMAHAR